MTKNQNPKNKWNLRFHGAYVPPHRPNKGCNKDCNNKPPSGDKDWDAYEARLRAGYVKWRERQAKELLLEKENNAKQKDSGK